MSQKTQQWIAAHYAYDPLEGTFTVMKARPKSVVGQQIDPESRIRLDGERVMLTHVIWFIQTGEWPDELVDHKDRDRRNIRFANLRPATHQENQRNKWMPNQWGLKGVCFNPKSSTNPWMALIRRDRKQEYLGCFPTPEQAHEAYCAAAKKYFGEFAQMEVRS
jgi:hypothetical protein